MLRSDGYRDKFFISYRGWLLQRSEVHCQSKGNKLMLLLSATYLLHGKNMTTTTTTTKQNTFILSFLYDETIHSNTASKARPNQWTRNCYLTVPLVFYIVSWVYAYRLERKTGTGIPWRSSYELAKLIYPCLNSWSSLIAISCLINFQISFRKVMIYWRFSFVVLESQ